MNRYLDSYVIGSNYMVPTLNGDTVRYVNLDNAASTPPFNKVLNKVNEFSNIYSNVHRGSGFKSVASSELYEHTRHIVAEFVGADIQDNEVIYVKNSTEALNKIAAMYELDTEDIVISSTMEHHSNDLPWRKRGKIKYIRTKETGELDLEHLESLLNQYKNRIKLVSITGASNVTGYINPIQFIAKLVHRVGAKIIVDASQLVPHRKIDIKNNSQDDHIDFIVFTSHKLYSPFGIGVLIGPKDFFENAIPDIVGGGVVKVVTQKEVYWGDTPERHEAGTPNIIGAIALGVAIKEIQKIGYHTIQAHEKELASYLVKELNNIDYLHIYGDDNFNFENRLGVVSFNIKDIPHGLAAAILSYEYGIGVRNGCFCAHPYVLNLLGVDDKEFQIYKDQILSGDKSDVPGLIRVSLGLYNIIEDIDRLILALRNIALGNYYDNYILDKGTGNYRPKGFNYQIDKIFSFD